MIRLKAFWRKYKDIIVGIVITILLGLLVWNSILLKASQEKNAEQAVTIELVEEMLATNTKILEENKQIVEQLREENKKNKEVVIIKNTEYEKVKNAPVKTNYTNAELLDWIKSYESDSKKGRNNSSKRINTK